MPAARYWRIIGITTYGGGDLELSEVALFDGATRVDGSATLTSSHAPIAGSLANLKDDDTGTTARFAAADVFLPGFALEWDFGSSQNVDRASFAGPSQSLFAHQVTLQRSDDMQTWVQVFTPLLATKYPGVGNYYNLDSTTGAGGYAGVVRNDFDSRVRLHLRSGDAYTEAASLLPAWTLGGYVTYSVAVSRDSNYIFIRTEAIYIVSYIRIKDKYYLHQILNVGGSQLLNIGAIGKVSRDGKYLAEPANSPARLFVFNLNGASFESTVSVPGVLSSSPLAVAFSDDGNYFAVTYPVTPFVHIYKIVNGVFTLLTTSTAFSPAPASSRTWVTFSPDSSKLFLVGSTANGDKRLAMYSISNDTFTEVAGADIQPSADVTSVAISPDGTHLAVALSAAPFMELYSVSGTNLTKLANPAYTLPAAGVKVEFSPDSQHLMWNRFGTYTPNSVVIFKRNGDSYSMIQTLDGSSLSNCPVFLPVPETSAGMLAANYDATPARPTPADGMARISEYTPPSESPRTLVAGMVFNPFKGTATLTGTVKKLIPPSSTQSLRRRVRLYQSAGMKLLDMVASDPVTGEFVFENVIAGEDYTVVAEDHEGIYRSAIVNGVRGV
jgi:hypothetical protein